MATTALPAFLRLPLESGHRNPGGLESPMLIQSSHLSAAPFRQVGAPARATAGIQAPAETFGPARPEDLQGLYGGPVFEG